MRESSISLKVCMKYGFSILYKSYLQREFYLQHTQVWILKGVSRLQLVL